MGAPKPMSIICPICGNSVTYHFTQKEWDDAMSLRDGRSPSTLDEPAYFRELFITGMCYKCQSETFHVSTPGYDLGEVIGECENCGCPLHDKDKENGRCPQCYSPIG